MFTPTEARANYKTIALATAGLLVLVATIWFISVKAHAETPNCRPLSHPSKVTPLSEGTVKDLNSHESRLDPKDLTTPTEDEAATASALRRHQRGVMWACGWSHSGTVMIVERSRQDADRCFGGAGCPSTVPQVWVTCYSGLDLADGRPTFPSGCIGFSPDGS